ncbi:unnamed protein product [Darwinula stevensoni]|uniref:Uncharacterized protein n=1 Tax=Darwinula stevensoni TaxID=69355 RepID=A0A7R9FRZ6_9CRUS|nr:unnamed protein product [Darwinula stevensoni]CAG0902432.1 unnamed protein product [Darwinula stevensoni]
MEQRECECPCECPLTLGYDLCQQNEDRHEEVEEEEVACHAPDETSGFLPTFKAHPPRSRLPSSLSCMAPRCLQRTSESGCAGVVGCEWCYMERDGVTPLDKPFCSSLSICFQGALHSIYNPYQTHDIEASLYGDEAEDLGGAPIGPVAGGIMACFLVLALGIYCYRHYSHMFGSHGEGTSWDSSQARLGPPTYVEDQDESDCPDSDEQEPPHPSSSGGELVAMMIQSPYRTSPEYRRPRNREGGGDSDHGYSTMTPHEEYCDSYDPVFPQAPPPAAIKDLSSIPEGKQTLLVPVQVHRADLDLVSLSPATS